MTQQTFIVDSGLQVTGSGGDIVMTGGNVTGAGNVSATNTLQVTGTGGDITLTGGNVSGANVIHSSKMLVNASHADIVIGDATPTSGPGMSSTSSLSVVTDSIGSNYVWIFANDGSMATPGPATINGELSATGNITANTSIISNVDISAAGNITASGLLKLGNGYIISPTNHDIIIDPNNNGYAFVKTPTFTDGGETLVINNQYPGSAGVQVVTEGANTYTFNGGALTFGQGATNYVSMNRFGISAHTQFSLQAENVANGTNSAILMDTNGQGVAIELVSGGNLYTWAMYTDNLLFPDGTRQYTAYTGGGGSYGNANVATFLASYGSNTITTTGNVSVGNVISSGVVSATGNVRGGNINTAGLITATGNITGGNITTGGVISATGNITGGNIIATNIGNIAAVNLTGSTSNVLYGNGTFAPITVSAISNISNGTSNVNISSSGGNVQVVSAGNTVANITGTGANITGTVSASGNITTGGQLNSSAFTGGNISWSTNNQIDFQGNIKIGTNNIKSGGGATSIVLNNNGANIGVLGVTSPAAATSNVTGALIVTGGAGISGNTYVSGSLVRTGAISNNAWTSNGIGLQLAVATYTDNSTASGTQATSYIHTMGAPALAFSNTVTITNAATLFVAAPVGSTNATITNPWAIIANGNVQVNGTSGISMPNLPAFRVYGNGVTNVSTTTNSNGVLNGNNWLSDYNQGSYLSSSTGTFTAPVGGLYQINLQMRVANNTAPTAQAMVVKNRASTNTSLIMWEAAANPTINHFGSGTVAKLAAGDTLNLVVTVGNLTFDQNDNWSVAFLG